MKRIIIFAALVLSLYCEDYPIVVRQVAQEVVYDASLDLYVKAFGLYVVGTRKAILEVHDYGGISYIHIYDNGYRRSYQVKMIWRGH